MTSSFHVEPGALTSTAAVFTHTAQDIDGAETAAENIQFGPGNAGRDYSSSGTAYHAAMLVFSQTLLTAMATKATWVGQTLTTSAADYSKSDGSAATGLDAAGQGA